MKELDEWAHKLSTAAATLQRTVNRTLRDMEATLAAARARRTPELIERMSETRYRRTVRAERDKGLNYVHAIARKPHPLTQSWFRYPDSTDRKA